MLLLAYCQGDLINLSFDRHLIKCPHCQEQSVHNWSGNMILFTTAKCTHCGREFLILLNEPRGWGPEPEMRCDAGRPHSAI